MKRKVLSLVVAAAWLGMPTLASACDTKIGYLFMNIPSSAWSLGGGVNVFPGTDGDDTFSTFNVDAGIGLGERAVVMPTVGYCTGGGDGEIVFGGGFGFNLWNNPDGSIMVNLQGALTHTSFEGDASQQSIPLSAAALFNTDGAASFFAGGGLGVSRFSAGDFSGSETDPFFYGGAMFGGSMQISVGGAIHLYDDTEFALNAGISVPMGG